MVAMTLRQRLRGSRGAELVELAVVLPLLLLLIGGIVDFAFMFQAFEIVTNAAREGARVGALPGYTRDDVIDRVDRYIAAANLPASASTTVTTINLANGSGAGAPTSSAVSVAVTYPHSFTLLGPVVSLFGLGSFPDSITLSNTSVMRREM